MTLCAHCGKPRRGWAMWHNEPLCHTDEAGYPDCYRLVTVYHEPLGFRKVMSIPRRTR